MSLLVLLIISYRHYNKYKFRIDVKKLFEIFRLNLINIYISTYALYKLIYYNPLRDSTLRYISAMNIFIIEITPVLYMTVVYCIALILVLSVYNHLSANIRSDIHITMIKTIVAVISVVLLIIIVNAVIFFIIHNYPQNQYNAIFDGNFLKDGIKSNYKLPKAFPDCLWFSATTFFTVGYGDMNPIGNIMYLISVMEMISAYILGIIMVPILLFKVPNRHWKE
ncbi:two pore domain potassium channel family protein [Clostridium sp. YIM B02515]|uniref:Two pore domain potassium channel family protein n=2 Tax=Clostridium rhizosphaerae TaxID=2803861 RepID=A0ABS1T4H7_9CLOT|nr:two pore domain potassium channel family protein [Clostridium rhizosphaerae]